MKPITIREKIIYILAYDNNVNISFTADAIIEVIREMVPTELTWKNDPEAKVYAEGFNNCREQLMKDLNGGK